MIRPAAPSQRLLDVVGDEEHGLVVPLPHREQQLLHHRSRLGVEAAEGLVESGLRNPLEPSEEESRDDIIESSLRREVFEELGIEIDIVRLAKIDAVPYVPEEPGPYRLDFYYRCLPKQGFRALREDSAVGASNRVRRK